MRRTFYAAVMMLSIGSLAMAGGATDSGAAGDPASAATGVASASGKYIEHPDLAARVAAGELPPVDERLPVAPLVRTVGAERWPLREQVGRYGGTLHVTSPSSAPWHQFPGGTMTDRLILVDTVVNDRFPFVLDDFEVQNDARTFILHLREGLRFSDGETFDADDLMFYYEDVLLNEDLNKSPPSWMVHGGQVDQWRKVDDWTVRIDTALPVPDMDYILYWRGQEAARHPKHYLSTGHASYQDAAELAAMVKERGFDHWTELFNDLHGKEDSYPFVEGHPHIMPWVLASGSSMGPWSFTRNPYFWSVDQEGRQLPYIDEVVVETVQDNETFKARVLAGQTDLVSVNDAGMLPLLMERQQRGELLVMPTGSTVGAVLDLHFNMTHKDPVLREIFQDKRFRIAVSHGLNRQALADTVFRGLVQPTQMAPPAGTEWYHEGLARAYMDHDVERANALLDEMGLTQRDGDGFRLRPDGKAVEFALHAHSINWPDAHEMVVDDLRTLGLKVHMDVPEAVGEIRDLNDGDAFLSRGMRANAGMAWHLGSAGPWVPQGRNANTSYPAMWAGEWAKWLASDGATGEEPPQLMKDLVSWYEQIQTEPDPARRNELAQRIFAVAEENLWVPGAVEAMGETMVANAKLGNVPRMLFFFRNGTEPEQIFFRQ